eukprot:5788390-Pleurochrysis_carterae.AAC.2
MAGRIEAWEGSCCSCGSGEPTSMEAENVIRRIYVILQKRRKVPFVAGDSGDGMAPLIHHCPSTY